MFLKIVNLSILDIGTNTVLHLAIKKENEKMIVLCDDHDIARLGEGVDKMKQLSREAQHRALRSIQRHLEKATLIGSERIIAVGTSALRDAENSNEFIELVNRETGVAVEVISGEEEARMTYAGAHFNLPLETKHSVVIDIGGGSTEIASGIGTQVYSHTSIDIGCVRLTERYLTQAPPEQKNIDAARNEIKTLLTQHNIKRVSEDTTVIGVAGTPTTLAQLVHHIVPFDREKIHGSIISAEEVRAMTTLLQSKSQEELRSMPGVDPRRSDILLAGLFILQETLTALGAETINVSVCGLRYGVALLHEL